MALPRSYHWSIASDWKQGNGREKGKTNKKLEAYINKRISAPLAETLVLVRGKCSRRRR